MTKSISNVITKGNHLIRKYVDFPRFLNRDVRFQAKLMSLKGKGKARDEEDSDGQGSVDSMMMDVDMRGSDFEEPPSDPPAKKKTTTKGKKTAAPAKKASAKTTTAKGRGKKAAVGLRFISCVVLFS